MKLFFISLFLFMSYFVLGVVYTRSYTKEEMLNYIKNDPVYISMGITNPTYKKLNDFKYDNPEEYFKKPDKNPNANPNSYYSKYYYDEMFADTLFYHGGNKWYYTDFASEQFDGRLEPVVVGEPLPSAPLTIFISTILLFTYLKYRKLHNKGEIQEIL